MARVNSIWGRLTQMARSLALYSDSTTFSLADFMVQGTSQIGDMTVANKVPIIERPAHLGISVLRDNTSATASASISGSVGSSSIVLRTAANADSQAILRTAERGRFIPGVGNQIGMAVRVDTTPTGSQVYRWGYYDDNDGMFFQYDTSGLSAVRRKGGTDNVIAQADWSGDRLDDLSVNDLNIDVFNGQIYYIDWGWYADNEITFELLTREKRDRVRLLELHRFPSAAFPAIDIPNLPIRMEIDNDGTTATATMTVVGRYYGALGEYNPSVRNTSDFRLDQSAVSSGAWRPAISMRRKSGYESVTIKIDGYAAVANNTVLAQVRVGSQVSGGAWETPDSRSADETALEVNNNMTTASGGQSIFVGIVPSSAVGNAGSNETPGLEIALPEGQTVTLFFRAVGQAATIQSVLRVNEEW